MRSLGELINAVRAEYPTMPELHRGRGLRTQWHRPPLFVQEGLQVGGIPLHEFLVPTAVPDTGEFRSTFETFIEKYVVGGLNDPTKWLQKELGLHTRLADWFFPKDLPLVEHYLAALIWYGSHSSGVEEFVLDEANCYVKTVTSLELGVKDHKLLSKFHGGFELNSMFDYSKALLEHHKSTTPRNSSDMGLAAFWHSTYHIKDESVRSNVQLALRILFYKYAHLGRLVEYLYRGHAAAPKNQRGHIKACKDLLNMVATIPNAMPTIFDTLNRRFMCEDEIVAMFKDAKQYAHLSSDVPVEMALMMNWAEALKSLIKQEGTTLE